MTVHAQPTLPMTRESAEVLITRQLRFRISGDNVEFIDFTDEDVATVRSVQPAQIPFQQLWRVAVANAMSLGNSEQRERELLVQVETLGKRLADSEAKRRELEELAKAVQPISATASDDEDDPHNENH